MPSEDQTELRRVLVVANETGATATALHEAIRPPRPQRRRRGSRRRARRSNTRLRPLVAGRATARAGARRSGSPARLDRLRAASGVEAQRRRSATADPLLAIADALRVFAADEIVDRDAPGGALGVARGRPRRPGAASVLQPIHHLVIDSLIARRSSVAA